MPKHRLTRAKCNKNRYFARIHLELSKEMLIFAPFDKIINLNKNKTYGIHFYSMDCRNVRPLALLPYHLV